MLREYVAGEEPPAKMAHLDEAVPSTSSDSCSPIGSYEISVEPLLDTVYTRQYVELVDFRILRVERKQDIGRIVRLAPELEPRYIHLKRVDPNGRIALGPAGAPELPDSFFEEAGVRPDMIETVKVPGEKPLTMDQAAFARKYWPTSFHPNKDIEAMLTGNIFPKKELPVVRQWIRTAEELGCVVVQKGEMLATGVTRRRLLGHPVMDMIDNLSQLERAGPTEYLATGCDVFLRSEPCAMCAMALVHARAANVFYLHPSANGVLGVGTWQMQLERSFNHHFKAFRVDFGRRIEYAQKRNIQIDSSKEECAWKVGSVLKMRHNRFHRRAKSAHGIVFKAFADVRIVKIQNEKKDLTQVLFVPHGDSLDIFNILNDQYKWEDGWEEFAASPVRIGPNDETASMYDFTMAISTRFNDLFESKALFNAYRGRKTIVSEKSSSEESSNEESSSEDYIDDDPYELLYSDSYIWEYFHDAGDRLAEFMEEKSLVPILNSPQHDALHSILTTFTTFNICQAPPGTGKTHIISHGLKLIRDHWDDERILLSAPTNRAIDNVVEYLHALEDDFPMCRETSKQGEKTASQTILKYLLSKRCFEELPNPEHRQALFDYERACDAVENKSIVIKERLNLLEVKHNAFSMLKKTWLECATPFETPSSSVRTACTRRNRACSTG